MTFKFAGSSWTGPKWSRRIGLYVWAFSSLILIFAGCAGAGEKGDFSDAIGFLAKEQSLAENYAAILKEFGKEDLQIYAEAIGLYANAKAEYDGLIEQMKYELQTGKTLQPSSEFQRIE